jgi:phospholipid-translocating ATPase
MFTTWGRSFVWWLSLILIVSSIIVFEYAIASLRSAFFTTPEDIFQALEKDPDVKRRFEEAAADELQQGWDRKTNKERDDEEKVRRVVKQLEAKEEERREEAVREMLRNRMGSEGGGDDKRKDTGIVGAEMEGGDVDRILSKGYGKVRED